jgi:hypothetical protein
VNTSDVSELLERAAASVTPVETDPGARLVVLGRRSVRRRRRAWAAAGAAVVAVAVAAVMGLPHVVAKPDRPAAPVKFGGLSVVVPEGWRTKQVPTFEICAAEPHTVYLATRWGIGSPAPSSGASGGTVSSCTSRGQAWMAVVEEGIGRTVSPSQLEVMDGQPLLVEQIRPYTFPSVYGYAAYDQEIRPTTVFISGDERGRERLLKRVTWPAGPPAPPSGGLVLPDRLTSALTDVPPSNGMADATDAETLDRILTALAGLREPVPAGEECALRKPGSVGISLAGPFDAQGLAEEINVVLGDATCPQAISTHGGRVRAPAGLGKELLDLIDASSRAAAKRAQKD